MPRPVRPPSPLVQFGGVSRCARSPERLQRLRGFPRHCQSRPLLSRPSSRCRTSFQTIPRILLLRLFRSLVFYHPPTPSLGYEMYAYPALVGGFDKRGHPCANDWRSRRHAQEERHRSPLLASLVVLSVVSGLGTVKCVSSGAMAAARGMAWRRQRGVGENVKSRVESHVEWSRFMLPYRYSRLSLRRYERKESLRCRRRVVEEEDCSKSLPPSFSSGFSSNPPARTNTRSSLSGRTSTVLNSFAHPVPNLHRLPISLSTRPRLLLDDTSQPHQTTSSDFSNLRNILSSHLPLPPRVSSPSSTAPRLSR